MRSRKTQFSGVAQRLNEIDEQTATTNLLGRYFRLQ